MSIKDRTFTYEEVQNIVTFAKIQQRSETASFINCLDYDLTEKQILRRVNEYLEQGYKGYVEELCDWEIETALESGY